MPAPLVNHIAIPAVGSLALAGADFVIQNSGFERDWFEGQIAARLADTDIMVKDTETERQVA